MPEGDTIYRSATRLRAVLEGKRVERFEAPRLGRHRSVAGSTVKAVEAKGKNLLIRFDNGLVLHTHMRMTGSWHTYQPGERWRKPPWFARVVMEVPGAVAVCFSAPVVELLDEQSEARHRGLAGLGPDLCTPDVDLDEALKRMNDPFYADLEIGEVLLDQRVACGVGNIYKSETLFACGVNPFTSVDRLDEPTRRHLLVVASRLMRQNLGGANVRTTYEGGVAVYGRARRACRRCGMAVEMRYQGHDARSTYWCPRCQPALP